MSVETAPDPSSEQMDLRTHIWLVCRSLQAGGSAEPLSGQRRRCIVVPLRPLTLPSTLEAIMPDPRSIEASLDPHEIALGSPLLGVQARAAASVSESYIPPGDEAVELPVDDLALRLLRLIDDGGQNHLLNRHNATWVGSWENHPGGESVAFLHAIAEAWDWLASRLLIARRPGDTGEFTFITRRGESVLAAKEGPALLRAEERIDVDLHPSIATRVRRQFLLGEYELAAAAAMREVEIRVRKLSKVGEGDIGVSLMQSAFKDGGPLADPRLEPGEREATMALFWGALGVFKNPWSHPQVEYDDPTLAAEVVLLADLLLRMLDRTGKRLKTTKSFAEHDARSVRRRAAAKKATPTRAARK
jgi:uncharacterized protein (TIGR02391 family)